jgi:ubiquinone/menaquinone biosynthesis C-methylase UbiE
LCSLLAGNAGDDSASFQNAEYEAKAAPYKRRLLEELPGPNSAGTTVLEIGIGGFSTAASYPPAFCGKVVGIEPDAAKHQLAMEAAAGAGICLEVLQGVAEELPLRDSSVDAAVTACTLCTVKDPRKALEEVQRVLKPGGILLFWEHVLSETDPQLAQRQIAATPEEVRRWGCRFDRRTLEQIKVAGFARVRGLDLDGSGQEVCYFELSGVDLMGPTAAGVAVVR